MDGERRCVAVIGGGAGGLAAALAAGERGAAVTIYEQSDRVGKKLLKTGNGRCNLSNRNIAPEGYNRPDFVAPALAQTDTAALLAFFQQQGLWTVEDGEGRLYPRSDTAASVLDVLRLGCRRVGAREQCSCQVRSLERRNGGFLLHFREGESVRAERVILASGGGTTLCASLGHRLVPFTPVLCPLRTDTAPIRGLSGLRVKCRVRLLDGGRELYAEAGEVLFRDYGVSGIVILNMSRYAKAGHVLALDLLPELTETELAARLRARALPPAECLTGIFHRRVGEALLRAAGGADAAALAGTIKCLRLSVLGGGDAAGAQVTRGGADTNEFDPSTLESRLCPGLYVVGEALDIDGRCGGYNLHWAFASGLAAGRSAAHG